MSASAAAPGAESHPLHGHEGVPRRGNAFSEGIGRAMLWLLGWRIEGDLPPVRSCVAIVAPHTSNWDFFVGLGGMFALRLSARFLGKHTIFRPPIGGLLRWAGGIPVDRRAPEGVVDSAVALFREGSGVCLVVAPEGTRRKVERWRTGFHRIARAAGAPIFVIRFDWSRRVIGLGPLFEPTADLEADLMRLRAFFDASMAYHPDQF